jgi:SNF2 family DNA or RNA helicase
MTLRDYQVRISDEAVEILKEHGLVYLAMEPRTGKTLTSIVTAYKAGAKDVLFVTKKKAINDILEQLDKLGYDINVHVINYERLHFAKNMYDLVICDEAHSIGAFPMKSNRCEELKRICDNKKIIYLSGTPSPESYSQLYHQFFISSFSPFKKWPTFYKWAHEFVAIKKVMINGQSFNDYKNADHQKVREHCAHLFISFTQEQAGFTSFVDEEIHYVKMMDSTYRLANRLKNDKVVTNADGDKVICETAVKLMQKLHQIFSGTIIIDEPERESRLIDESKISYIKERFKYLNKYAIFYKFKQEGLALMTLLDRDVYIDAMEFEKSKKGVFISQIVSGREGINLQSAEALIMYNIDFSATSYWQTRARIQTRDKESECKVHWLFSVNGIEDKIHKAVSDKKDYTIRYFKTDFL